MAKFVMKDVEIVVDGTTLSDHASSVTIETSDDDVDSTGFGANAKEHSKGLKDASASVTFQQDFDAGSVDDVLWPLSQSDTPFEVYFKPTTAAISNTNPAFRLPESLLFGYSPLAGSVGELSTTDVTFQNAGQQGLVRDITP